MQGRKDELTSCRGTVKSAPKKGKWPLSGTRTTVLTYPAQQPAVFRWQWGVRQGNRQGWWKRSTFRWNGRQLTLDRTVGSRVWWHTQGSSVRPASDLGWGSPSKTAPGSLSTGSPAGRTPPHGDGSMYSQANVRAGTVLRPPIRALPSVIGDTEKVLREADGPVEKWLHRESASGGKVIAPGCTSKAGRVSRWGARRSQAEARTKGAKVHFASLMDICHLKNAELEAKHQKYKGRIVLWGDIVKDDSGSYAVSTEQGSSASQMIAAKVMDVI